MRTGALILRDQALLLVRLKSPVRRTPVWMPPGGEVEPGESLRQAVKREVREETGLEIVPGRISLICQFIEHPLHAVEFYHVCHIAEGDPVLGKDPEMPDEEQILSDLKFFPLGELPDLELYPEILRTKAELLTTPAGETVFSESPGG